ncbi:MAG: chaperone NapD [Deferribacteres bacterium]|nr:chaperone NapD [Deferribacteres bacterium]
MPVGGFVVSVLPDDAERLKNELALVDGVEVYGWDEKGNIVVVIEAETSDLMEELVEKLKRIDGVLTVGLAYLHFEDEVDKIERGEIKPEAFGRRKGRE